MSLVRLWRMIVLRRAHQRACDITTSLSIHLVSKQRRSNLTCDSVKSETSYCDFGLLRMKGWNMRCMTRYDMRHASALPFHCRPMEPRSRLSVHEGSRSAQFHPLFERTRHNNWCIKAVHPCIPASPLSSTSNDYSRTNTAR